MSYLRYHAMLLMTLAVSAGAAGPGGERVPADELVAEALAHSPLLKASRADASAAAARGDQADALRWPEVAVDARAARYEGLEDSVFGPAQVIPAIEERYAAGITVTERLFTGGRVSGERRAAGFRQQGAELDAGAAEADLILRVLQAYWRWSKAGSSVVAFEASVKRMEQHDRDMANLHKAGLATDNDALATEVLLEQTRLRLAAARRAEETARADLAYLTGRELSIAARPDDPPASAPAALEDEAVLLNVARDRRAELAASRARAEAARSAVKATRAAYFPQVSLQARYEQARPNLLNIPPEDRWAGDAFVGVLLNWNVFDFGLTKARVREAEARLAQAELLAAEQEERVVLDVRDARIAMLDAVDRLEVATRVMSSAERNLRAATDLWKNGMARHADVLDAHAQLTDAGYQVVSARADTLIARAALDRATGRLQGK